MDVSTDKEIYLLSKIVGELGSEKEGNEFLIQYWIKSGKLKYTQKLLGESFSVREDEIHYLINVENLCEGLINSLNSFLREPYCGKNEGATEIDKTVKLVSSELIVAFEQLQTVSLNYGWESLVATLSRAVFQINALCSRLIAMHVSGKKIYFCTNVSAEDFLKSNQIDFCYKGSKYFLVQG